MLLQCLTAYNFTNNKAIITCIIGRIEQHYHNQENKIKNNKKLKKLIPTTNYETRCQENDNEYK